ncbi:DNA-binding transcriptional LysR family regulator [Kineococcus aurantiacus]|uniref:DNA-binding transcriptional LysR family regulator n=1 Tax=Kineococcus aurantiacus TaxID=37633 RepID=A0A7Y9DQJ0_9ACTN|nr:DNA-binding transcriptional LysR family regulator [Kineococcus aurantiacus]
MLLTTTPQVLRLLRASRSRARVDRARARRVQQPLPPLTTGGCRALVRGVDIDTGLLRALVVLAEESHFGRAADRLDLTQQALSKRIKRLETEVGALLVDRDDRRRIRLTAAGQHALPTAREVLAAVDRLDLARERAGRLRVDVMSADLATTAWVRRATRTHGLPLDVVHRPVETTAEHLLRSGGTDLAFGRSGAVPTPWPTGIHHRLVLLEPLAVLVPGHHRWAQLEELALEQLTGQHLWFPMAAAPLEWRSYTSELCLLAGIDLDTTGSTFGFQQWAEDVSTGVCAPSLIGEAMRTPDPRMRTVPIVNPTPVFPWSLLWRDELPVETVSAVLTGMGFATPAPCPDPDIWMPAADRAFLELD